MRDLEQRKIMATVTTQSSARKYWMFLVFLIDVFDRIRGKSLIVELSTERIFRTTSDKFLSVTWGSTEHRYGWRAIKTNKFPKIISLARGLTPAYLRVGGTAQDFMHWEKDGKDLSCYNASQLDALYDFEHNSGLDIIFALPAMTRKPDGSWDSENSVKLFKYIEEKRYSMDSWELGNEPELWPRHNVTDISPEQLAKDFDSLRALLKKRGKEFSRLYGPDSAYLSGILKRFLASVKSGTLDAVTYHQYYRDSHGAKLEDFLNVTLLDTLIYYGEMLVHLVHSTQGTSMPVWLGETSSTYDSGAPGLSDSYVAGFMWLDKLGVTALVNHSVVCRQSFYGGHYSLLEMNTFDPLPDYWTSVLYKRLVGPKVLMVKDSLKPGRKARIYAHCTRITKHYNYEPGAITLIVLNLDKNEEISLELQEDLKKLNADQFLLQPEANSITSKTVKLNDKPLKLLSKYQLPDLKAVQVKQPFAVPALNYGFFVIPRANAKACLKNNDNILF